MPHCLVLVGTWVEPRHGRLKNRQRWEWGKHPLQKPTIRYIQIGSDHYIEIAELKFNLRSNALEQERERMSRYIVEFLKDPNTTNNTKSR